MMTDRFHAESIRMLLQTQTIATMDDLVAALSTASERTVFRKLKELRCRSSYSHRGRYYTLDELAEFDERGLWSCRSVRFSVYGTLLATAAATVEASDAGCFVDELDNALHVGTKDALRKLVGDGRLTREKVGGQYLYCSGDASMAPEQLAARHSRLAQPMVGGPLPDQDFLPDELKAAIILFFCLLDEKQQRLYAGLESLKIGRGGDRQIAGLLGVDPGTVSRGRRDLLQRDIEVDRVRRVGGGRKPVEKKHPK